MKMIPTQFGEWAIECHQKTNHFYDDNLPYDYHLDLTVQMGYKFKHLLPLGQWLWQEDINWGHDTIEDVRKTYNEVLFAAKNIGLHTDFDAKRIAEGIRAVTNYGRGRDRNERMPDWIYDEIRNTEGATFAKLCDRCANVKHGLISGSSMRKKYLKENLHFSEMLYTIEYDEIWQYLEKLLTIEI